MTFPFHTVHHAFCCFNSLDYVVQESGQSLDGPVNPLLTDALPKKHGVDTTDQIRKSCSFTVMGTEGGECCTTSQCLDVIPTFG